MRRWWLAGLACIVFFQFATLAQADRSVQDNMFVSTRPQLTVKVNPPFRYIGEAEFATKTELGNQTEGKAYVFIDNDQEQVQRIFYIELIPELLRLPGNLLGNVAADLDFGTCTLADRQYQCSSSLISLTGNEPVATFITARGYSLPPCLLVKSFMTTERTHKSYLIGIFYLEAVSGPVFQCGPSRSTAPLSSAQQELLRQFEKNCMDAFEAHPRRAPGTSGSPGLYGIDDAPLPSSPTGKGRH
jgi:hypothetical protein